MKAGQTRPSLLVISSYPSDRCGVADYTSQLLRRIGRDVNPTSMQLDLRAGAAAYARQCLALARAITARRFQCVHLQYTPTTSGPLAPAILWFARVRGARIVVSAHERPSTYERRLLRPLQVAFKLYERALLRSCQRVFVFSHVHADELASRHGVAADAIHMGIDAQDPIPLDDSGGPLPRLAFAGFVRPSKGVDLLVRAAPIAARRAGPFRVTIAGATSPRDAAYATRLRSEIERANAGAPCEIDWVGELPVHEYREVLRSSRLFVFPFRTVSQSITFNEVVALGIPVVASDVGGVGEVVARYGTGLTFPSDDLDALADAIVRMLSDDALYQACRDRTLAYARLADWTNIARLHAETYHEALAA